MLIKFNKQMMQVVNEALVRMPYAQAAPVINEINRQIQAIQESQKEQQIEAMEVSDAAGE